MCDCVHECVLAVGNVQHGIITVGKEELVRAAVGAASRSARGIYFALFSLSRGGRGTGTGAGTG